MEEEGDMEVPRPHRRHIIRKLFLFLFIVLIVACAIYWQQIYFYANLLLGNNYIVSVSVDKENVFVSSGASQNIKFQVQASANPFCTSECKTRFIDLSKDELVAESNILINLPGPQYKTYSIDVNNEGAGQKLYRFQVRCTSYGNKLCHTAGESRTRSVLVTVNYGFGPDKEYAMNNSKNQLISLWERASNIYANLAVAQAANNQLPANLAEKQTFDRNLIDAKTFLLAFNSSLESMKSNWEAGNYQAMDGDISRAYSDLTAFETKYEEVLGAFSNNLTLYNSMVGRIAVLHDNLYSIIQNNLTSETLTQVDDLIKRYNAFVSSFNSSDSIANKSLEMKRLYIKMDAITSLTRTDASSSDIMPISSLSLLPWTKLNVQFNRTNFTFVPVFSEPKKQCCILGECGICCDNSCRSESDKYPIVMIHGHDFNSRASAESSLDTFTPIQNALENEGYLNAGSLLLGDIKPEDYGLLGLIEQPISLKASFYFDLYKNTKSSTLIQTKTDSIDTYAIRLRDIIDTVKLKTNRDKVIVIAHSMGGLVVRRYNEIFDRGDIYKIILIATPNHGIEGTVATYCPILGAGSECSDMNKDSLFINKLNNEEKMDIPIYNIIGFGCDTEGQTGDGVVTNSSAYLEGAKNYYVQGVCSGKLHLLHNAMTDPDSYPEAFKIINESIRGEI